MGVTAVIDRKICADCHRMKNLSEYYVNIECSDGYFKRCKECANSRTRKWERNNPERYTERMREASQRARDKRKKMMSGNELKDFYRNAAFKCNFGITLQEYNFISEQQCGVCAICKKPESAMIKGKLIILSVDHCHKTGKVRGLLCKKCNSGLGHFNDNPLTLKKAALYLDYHLTN